MLSPSGPLALLLVALLHAATMAASTADASKTVNHLLRRPSLSQSYCALRHGQSLANVEKIISSDPAISTVKHGLSDVGKGQARAAGESFAAEHAKPSDGEPCDGVAVFSSDFVRARETASLFAEGLRAAGIPLYAGDVVLERRLRERNFGELNGGPDTRYQEVWDVDVRDPNHCEFGVESANAVLERTTGLIAELDERLRGEGGGRWSCVLVAHGDVLQILQTGFLRHEDAARHRSLEHLETATIRELSLASG